MRDEDTLSLGVFPAYDTFSWYTSATLGDCAAGVAGSLSCLRGVVNVKLAGAAGAVDALGTAPPSDECIASAEL